MAVTASPGAGRVLIALTAGPLVAEPTWTRYDNLSNCRCHGFDCESGRQSELDTIDTGTARVFFHDRAAVLDDDDLVGLQIMLQLYNPVTETWHPRWRGHIDDISRVPSPGAPELADTQIDCVDIFDYLGGVKFLPGVMGDVGPADDVVFYEDERVDDRIIHLLTDAQIVTAMRVVFEGNVFVNETLYDGDDVILTGIRDASDAEFPNGVSLAFVDRFGRVQWHGRLARFDPEGVEAAGANWNFVRWEAATREDVTTGFAQIREFAYNRPRARIINSYLAWPRADENGVEFDRTLIPTLLKTDATSITTYGYRGRDAPDLIVQKEYVGAGGRTSIELCGLYGEFYISNYQVPRKAIQRVSLKSLRPDDARAAATWALMAGVDISDAIDLTVDEAALADVPFFVDGVSVQCRPLNQSFDMVTVTPNLTPASYYGTDVFDVGT